MGGGEGGADRRRWGGGVLASGRDKSNYGEKLLRGYVKHLWVVFVRFSAGMDDIFVSTGQCSDLHRK